MVRSSERQAAGFDFPFQDPFLPVDQRFNYLVSRLTLEEKTDQFLNGVPAIERLGVPAYNW